MPKVKTTVYAVLAATRSRYHAPSETTGQRPVESFKIDRFTKNLPTTKANEVAVKLTLALDSSIFDKLIPVVEIELGERDLFVNRAVEVNGEAVPQVDADPDPLA